MRVVEKVFKINKELLKINQFLEIENVLSCDKFRAIVKEVDDFKLTLFRLRDYKVITISSEQLEHYEVKFMKLEYINENKSNNEADSINQNKLKINSNKEEKEKTCEYRLFEDLMNELMSEKNK